MSKIILDWATIFSSVSQNNASMEPGIRVPAACLQPVEEALLPRPGLHVILTNEPLSNEGDEFVRQYPQVLQLPNPHLWVALVSKAILEAITGQRPIASLESSCTVRVYQGLVNVHRHLMKAKHPPVKRRYITKSVHIYEVGKGAPFGFTAIEATVNNYDGRRFRAMALRIAPRSQGWIVEELEMA